MDKVFRAISREYLFKLLGLLLLVNMAALTYFNTWCDTSETFYSIKTVFSKTEFQRQIEELFRTVQKDNARFSEVRADLQHLEVKVPLNKILPDKNIPSSIQYYDPRLTIAVYSNELKRIGNTKTKPSLPFHWADWMNFEVLNKELKLDISNRTSCSSLKTRIQNIPENFEFCLDKNTLSDKEVEEMGFMNREQLPNALIHNAFPWDTPIHHELRVFMAKSYSMTHMPKPAKVIILSNYDDGGTYEFLVDQKKDTKQMIAHSGMTERFVSQANTFGRFGMNMKDTFKFNPKDAYLALRTKVLPQKLAVSDDVMGMHRTVTSPKDKLKTVKLKEEHFFYPPEKIQEQIKEYEDKLELTFIEQNYLDGLRECSRYTGENEPTYFKLANLDTKDKLNTAKDGGWHYDWRFFSRALQYSTPGWTKRQQTERTNIVLTRLLRSWNRFAEEKGIVSWIMHGPLLSWYWNGHMFPFDNDIDIQMPISELIRLAKDYNQTLVVESPMEGYAKYLIDVGTTVHNRDKSLTNNHIDARFIDVDTGSYIDITALAKSSMNLTDEYQDKPIVQKGDGDANAEVYNDRQRHFYTLNQLQPLRYTMLEGMPVYVPRKIKKRLDWEYERGTRAFEFQGLFYFVPRIGAWVPRAKLMDIFQKSDFQDQTGEFVTHMFVERVRTMNDEDVLQLLENDEILSEYYRTKEPVEWHEREKALLFSGTGNDNPFFLANPNTREQYEDLVSEVKFGPSVRKCLYEYEQDVRGDTMKSENADEQSTDK